MLLHHRQLLERHAARFLRARLPFLDRVFAGVQVAGEHRLAYLVPDAQLLDLRRRDRRRHDEARRIEVAHGRLVDGAHLVKRVGGRMNRRERIASEFASCRHRKSPCDPDAPFGGHISIESRHARASSRASTSAGATMDGALNDRRRVRSPRRRRGPGVDDRDKPGHDDWGNS